MIYILLLVIIFIVMVGAYLYYKHIIQNYNDQDLNKEQKKAKRFYNNLKIRNHE